jgi:hypothetical protein
MSIELLDLRAKISLEADCVLSAVSKSSGIDRSELVREILHSWALKRMRAATVLAAQMKLKGITAASQGPSALENWDSE